MTQVQNDGESYVPVYCPYCWKIHKTRFPLMKRKYGLWCPLCEVIVAEGEAIQASEASLEGYESKNIGKDISGHEITDIPE